MSSSLQSNRSFHSTLLGTSVLDDRDTLPSHLAADQANAHRLASYVELKLVRMALCAGYGSPRGSRPRRRPRQHRPELRPTARHAPSVAAASAAANPLPISNPAQSAGLHW